MNKLISLTIFMLIIGIIICIFRYYSEKYTNIIHSPPNGINNYKTLVMYCYYETDETKDNLNFFVNNGIYNNPQYQYIIIINNKKCSVNIPDYSNIKVIKRTENNSDLFTYKLILETFNQNLLDSYDRFYFINSSCLGPFMSNINSNSWIDSMNLLLNDYDLIGPVVEIPGDNLGFKALNINSNKNIPFIHTYFFGLNKFGFKILQNIFDEIDVDDKKFMVVNTERKITSAILTKNGKIKSFLTKFKNVDLNDQKNWQSSLWNKNNKGSCYEIPNNYDGIDLNPYEIVFFKNIRNANTTRPEKNAGVDKIILNSINKYKHWLK